jgi:hypothetical protein
MRVMRQAELTSGPQQVLVLLVVKVRAANRGAEELPSAVALEASLALFADDQFDGGHLYLLWDRIPK